MLTKEENELLTRVAPGTPCGELLRRYWQPICFASQLTDDRPKRRVLLLGEDLVVFRSREGTYGLVAEQCSHRGASLYYGFLEANASAHRELHRAGQHVREQRRLIWDELHFDLVYLWSSQGIRFVRLQHDVASPHPITDFERAIPHEGVSQNGRLMKFVLSST